MIEGFEKCDGGGGVRMKASGGGKGIQESFTGLGGGWF